MRTYPDILPRDDWLHFLRHRDLEQIMADSPKTPSGPVLEIGCGDGYVTKVLRRRFGQVVPIDPAPRDRVDGLVVARAEALPFRDGYFGLVYSSNVLEHVDGLEECFRELKRVCRNDAMMVHSIPTSTWKTLQFVLYPVHTLVHGLVPKLSRLYAGLGRRSVPKTPNPGANSVIGAPRVKRRRGWLREQVWPPVHGTSRSHLEEFRRLRRKWWLERFSSSGLEVLRTSPLYLHSAYRFLPYRALALRERVSRAGLSSVRAYWLKKAG